jgi:hypothetical protein
MESGKYLQPFLRNLLSRAYTSSTLKKELTNSSDTLVYMYQTILHQIPETVGLNFTATSVRISCLPTVSVTKLQ